MARTSINAGAVKMDASEGGALTDYSNEIITATLTIPRKNSTHHTLGLPGGVVVVGKYSGTLQITYEAGTTATALHNLISVMATDSTPSARSFEVGTPDLSNTGSLKFAFEAHLVNAEAVKVDAGGDGVQILSATFEIEGAITQTVIT